MQISVSIVARQEGVGRINWWNFFIFLIVILIFSGSAAGASNHPYKVITTEKYVEATAKCSCGSGSWSYRTATFLNYCPQCHSYGSLGYTKDCDAGQWTCSRCDCDYCMQDGKEKVSGSGLYLVRYHVRKVKVQHEKLKQQPYKIDRTLLLKNIVKNKWEDSIWINQ